MTENEKELLPENHFYNQSEEPIQLSLSENKQLGRMIKILKTVQTEEAKEIIEKNYKKGSGFILKRVKEENKFRNAVKGILCRSEESI